MSTFPGGSLPEVPEGCHKRQAILRISGESLAEVLKLPPGTRIVDISPHVFFNTSEFALKVEHASFPEVMPGYPVPTVNALYRTVRTAEFMGWDW